MNSRRPSGNGSATGKSAARSFAANVPSHFTEAGQERDRLRDEALARKGYLVVRISGFDVLREPERGRERMRELGVD